MNEPTGVLESILGSLARLSDSVNLINDTIKRISDRLEALEQERSDE